MAKSKFNDGKMDPKIKKLWIDALLSDQYDQNFDGWFLPLRTEDNRWSPFGVLCNIHAQRNPEIAKQQFSKTEYMEYEFLLPSPVMKWCGIDKKIVRNECYFKRTVKFDGKVYDNIEDMAADGVPFFIIADVIDEQF